MGLTRENKMKKFVVSGLLALSVLAGTSAPSFAMMHTEAAKAECMARGNLSEAECTCIANQAGDRLTAGEIATLLKMNNGEKHDVLPTAREESIGLIGAAKIYLFTKYIVPACVVLK